MVRGLVLNFKFLFSFVSDVTAMFILPVQFFARSLRYAQGMLVVVVCDVIMKTVYSTRFPEVWEDKNGEGEEGAKKERGERKERLLFAGLFHVDLTWRRLLKSRLKNVGVTSRKLYRQKSL